MTCPVRRPLEPPGETGMRGSGAGAGLGSPGSGRYMFVLQANCPGTIGALIRTSFGATPFRTANNVPVSRLCAFTPAWPASQRQSRRAERSTLRRIGDAAPGTRRPRAINRNIVMQYAMLTGSSGGDGAGSTGDHLGALRGVCLRLHLSGVSGAFYVIAVAFRRSGGHYCSSPSSYCSRQASAQAGQRP